MDKLQYDEVCNAEFWHALCPNLQVCSGQGSATQACKDAPGVIRNRLDEDGYTMLSGMSKWPADLRSVEQGINTLVTAGWPASFIMMFDEPWLLMQAMSPLMLQETGNAPNMDMLAWRVDAAKGEAGFAPHRDRQPDNSPASFRQDKSAKYTSCWLAITDATPDTSCLYVIPRIQDPGYFRGDPEEAAAPDPLDAALPCKEAFQHVRALPCTSGEAVVFTHRIIHWGSAGTQHARHPRISLSFGFSDGDFEAPYFNTSHLPLPPLHLRLALVSAQMLTYYQRFPPSAALLTLYKAAVNKSASDLDPEYRRKVLAHFVHAARELHETAGCGPDPALPEGVPTGTRAVEGSSGAATPAGDSDPDDVVDAAMDAMLDAELEGQNVFEDDFDDIASAGDEAEFGTGENDALGLDEENEGENDEELPIQTRASNDPEPEAAGGAHAAAAAHVQAQNNSQGEDNQDDAGTPRGSENAAQQPGGAFRPPAQQSGARGVVAVPVAPVRMAAGNGGVLRVDSHSMRSAGGEESTVLCAMDAFDEASLGEGCTSRVAPWEIGGILAWGKKRKR